MTYEQLHVLTQLVVSTGEIPNAGIPASDRFLSVLEDTGNTVCGRHPIGVIMAAVEVLEKDDQLRGDGRFKFVRYERSSLVTSVRDSSVSYCSAFAVL